MISVFSLFSLFVCICQKWAYPRRLPCAIEPLCTSVVIGLTYCNTMQLPLPIHTYSTCARGLDTDSVHPNINFKVTEVITRLLECAAKVNQALFSIVVNNSPGRLFSPLYHPCLSCNNFLYQLVETLIIGYHFLQTITIRLSFQSFNCRLKIVLSIMPFSYFDRISNLYVQ